jgi:hypothetical protein
MTKYINCVNGILGCVEHYMCHYEVQHRLSLHAHIIYINSVSSVSVTEVLGGGGRERRVKQRVISSVSLSVEVLKPRSHLFICRGPKTQIPSVRLSRS